MNFALFIIEPNVSIPNTEHAGSLFWVTITKKISFCLKKKTAIVIKSMTHFTQNGIFDIFKNYPFKLDTFLKLLFFLFHLKDLKMYI